MASQIFNRIFAQNCLLDTSQAAKIGVLHIEEGADDTWVSNSEFTSSAAALSDANAYLCAVFVGSSNNQFQDVIAEISDIGFHIPITGSFNKFTSCRGEFNYSHGWEILGGGNIFTGCLAYSNGRETDDTYDGFHSTATANSNVFSGCMAASEVAGTESHRYGFYDGYSGEGLRSQYTGCHSLYHQTAAYYTNPTAGVSPLIPDQGLFTLPADVATPNVDNRTFFSFYNYTVPTDITNFVNGVQGQVITITDSTSNRYITIKDNATIHTNLDADLVLTYDKFYAFRLIGTVWNQVVDQRSGPETATGVYTCSSEGATKIDSSAGAVTATLGSGKYIGQIKTIVMTNSTASSTVTVTNLDNVTGIPLATGIGGDGEVGTFDAVDEAWILMWMGTEWTTLRATCTF